MDITISDDNMAAGLGVITIQLTGGGDYEAMKSSLEAIRRLMSKGYKIESKHVFVAGGNGFMTFVLIHTNGVINGG